MTTSSKIVYIKGDILNSNEPLIVHGCNCFNTMGSGLAKQVREQVPSAWEADQETEKGNREKLGTYTYGFNEEDGKLTFVINAYTQYRYGHDKVYADYTAIENVLNKICKDFETFDTIAIPKIGCGLANGDWAIVSEIVEKVATSHNKIFHVYEYDQRM